MNAAPADDDFEDGTANAGDGCEVEEGGEAVVGDVVKELIAGDCCCCC